MATDRQAGQAESSRNRKPDPFEKGETFVQVRAPFLGEPGLTPIEKIVLMTLESYAWGKDTCRPGNRQIAERAGLLNSKTGKPAPDRVQNALQSLQDKGWIYRENDVINGETKRKAIHLKRVRTGDRPNLNGGEAVSTKDQPDGGSGLDAGTVESPPPTVESPHGVRRDDRTGTVGSPPKLEALELDESELESVNHRHVSATHHPADADGGGNVRGGTTNQVSIWTTLQSLPTTPKAELHSTLLKAAHQFARMMDDADSWARHYTVLSFVAKGVIKWTDIYETAVRSTQDGSDPLTEAVNVPAAYFNTAIGAKINDSLVHIAYRAKSYDAVLPYLPNRKETRDRLMAEVRDNLEGRLGIKTPFDRPPVGSQGR